MTVILLTFRDLSFRKYYVIIVACPRKKNGISFQFLCFHLYRRPSAWEKKNTFWWISEAIRYTILRRRSNYKHTTVSNVFQDLGLIPNSDKVYIFWNLNYQRLCTLALETCIVTWRQSIESASCCGMQGLT